MAVAFAQCGLVRKVAILPVAGGLRKGAWEDQLCLRGSFFLFARIGIGSGDRNTHALTCGKSRLMRLSYTFFYHSRLKEQGIGEDSPGKLQNIGASITNEK